MEQLLRPVRIDVAANSRSVDHAAAGKYLRIKSNTITPDITVFLDNDKYLNMHPGSWVRIPFRSIAIQNDTANPATVMLEIGDDSVGDESMTIGGIVNVDVNNTPNVNVAAVPAAVTNALTAIETAVEAVQAELQGDTTFEDWGDEKSVGVAAVELLDAEVDRKGGIIQSKSTNTGIIYIGFADTVTSTKWVVELLPGASWQIDDYRGPIFAIATVAAQKVGWGEW